MAKNELLIEFEGLVPGMSEAEYTKAYVASIKKHLKSKPEDYEDLVHLLGLWDHKPSAAALAELNSERH